MEIKYDPTILSRDEFEAEMRDLRPAYIVELIPALVSSPDFAFARTSDNRFASPTLEGTFRGWYVARATFLHQQLARLENEIEITTRIIEDPFYAYLNEPPEDRTPLTDAAYSFVTSHYAERAIALAQEKKCS